MDLLDFLKILPLVVLATTSVVLMLVIAFQRNYKINFLITLAGLILAFVSLLFVGTDRPLQITSILVINGSSVFYIGLLISGCFIAALLSYGYIEKYKGNREEYYILLIIATLGSSILVASDHFISFFLGLEILSVSLYGLIAYPHHMRQRIEASIKYLILAGATSAILLFGMALIYTVLGTMEFSRIAISGTQPGNQNVMMLAGWGLLTVGIGFKLALVPFQYWTPDVYQGAPAPVTGFIASISKGGMFALMLRYFSRIDIFTNNALLTLFAVIAIASMLYGNIVALMQHNIKRILAYSSIAHLGYLLVAFLASGSLGPQAVAFYLVAYFLTTLSAFGVITLISTPDHEIEELNDYESLVWRHPVLGIIFTISLLSLAGIPPTIGLIGKIFIAAAGVQSSLWVLLGSLIVGSVVGVFYYLRIVITMFRPPEEGFEPVISLPTILTTGGVVLSLLTFLIISLGIYPLPVMQIISRMITTLP
jgi:NADH-quinone oxidoreductase subunit N